jgi:phosphopantothenoylcysteine decarboxylase/phosphopantothenate--cysteine ligase
LALWADLMVIAPASINTIAKLAYGFTDNALTTLVAALRSPLLLCPTADVDMYNYPITQQNIAKLKSIGKFVLEPEQGELASGLSGEGRLPSIDKIVDMIELIISGNKVDLIGKKILVTAGPTYEDIDPIRFIGNRSSGKMGFQIAKAAFLRGADVTLISGPTSQTAYPEIKMIKIRSAQQMKKAVEGNLKDKDAIIMSAAVADYKPQKISLRKIKKEEKLKAINLTGTDDILASVKKDKIKKIGFALETENEKSNAIKKLKDKKLDLIILNSLRDKKSGFEFDTNKVTIINVNGKSLELPLLYKFQAANAILSEIKKIF